MNCCGKDMKFLFKTDRGRWKKEIYKCQICGQRFTKRVTLIPNNLGRGF